MLTGIAPPTTWPFFKRGSASAPPVRTALGTALDSAVGIMAMVGISLDVGDFLLCATVSDTPALAPSVVVDIDGAALLQPVAIVALATTLVTINALKIVAPVVAKDLTATWVGSPDYLCMAACKVTNLSGVLLQTRNNTYAATTAPDSGTTAAFAGPAFHWAIVGLRGRGADALGAWQNGNTAGQRVSSGGIVPHVDLKESWRVATGQPGRSNITGQTSRLCAAIVCHYQ
jgi:hypothetical protein